MPKLYDLLSFVCRKNLSTYFAKSLQKEETEHWKES